MIYKILKSIDNRLAVKRAIKAGMKLGKGCRFLGSHDFGSEPYLIEIGDNVTVSSDVSFINHDGGTAVVKRLNPKRYSKIIKYGKITIGENCFIGSRTMIMPGVRIGSNCVIGAGSVITKNIPDNSVAVGVPAKIIRTVEDYAERCLNNCPEYSEEQYLRDKKSEILRIYKNR